MNVFLPLIITSLSLLIVPIKKEQNVSLYEREDEPSRGLVLTTTLIDNEVYLFRSAADTTKSIDVKSANYSNGNETILWPNTNLTNQRFVLKRADDDSWFLSPLGAQIKFMAISGTTDKLIIRPEEYGSQTNLDNRRFQFVYNPYTSSFKIYTGASNYNQCLSLTNGSTANGTTITQQYVTGTTAIHEWKLYKADTLTLNTKKTVTVNSYSYAWFNLRVPRTFVYIIEARTSSSSSMDLLLASDSSLVYSSTYYPQTSSQRIVGSITAETDYKLRFFNSSTNQVTFDIALFPNREVYFYSYFDNFLDTTSDIVGMYSSFFNNNFYVNHRNNGDISFLNEIKASTKTEPNNYYFFISSHGSLSGNVYTKPSTYFSYSALPDMSNVQLALWSICYGGKYGNVAEESVLVKQVNKSIGWPGTIGDDTAKYFTDTFWNRVLNYCDSFEDAMEYSKNATSTHFGILIQNDDTILQPRMFRKSLPGIILSPSVPTDFEIDITNLLEINPDDFHVYGSNVQSYRINSRYVRYYETIDGDLTNCYYLKDNVLNKTYRTKHSTRNNFKRITNKTLSIKYGAHNILEKKRIYLFDNETIDYVEIAFFKDSDESKIYSKITSLLTGKVYSFEEFLYVFN